MSDGRSFARNSTFNLLGLVLPLGVAVLAIPPLVRGLGPERFSILTLAAAAIGYFGLFEFGLGRALTQGVAQRLGTPEERDLPSFVWTALAILLLMGVIGAVALAATTTLLVTRVLNVSPAMQGEAVRSFYLLAFALPLVITTGGLRGIMEAHQHFGMINALRIPLLAFTFAGPLLVLPFSRSLVPAIAVLVAARVIGWLLHAFFCARHYAYMRQRAPLSTRWVTPLLRYGGWTTVTNVVGPIMVYLDRFFLAAILPLAAVAAYVTPFELVTKLTVVSAAIFTAVFPSFAASVASDRDRMRHLYGRSVRAVLLAIFPVVLCTVALAHEGLRLWIGSVLPEESALVLQWLAVGILINAVAQAPYTALQGAGRPDLTAKLHLAEAPLYMAGLWLLTVRFGVTGAAIAWTLRVTVDTIALLFVARRTLGMPLVPQAGLAWTFAAMLASLGAAAMLRDTTARLLYVGVVLAVFSVVARQHLLHGAERKALWQWLREGRRGSRAVEELS